MDNNNSLNNQTIRRLYQQKRRNLSPQYQQDTKQHIAHTLALTNIYQSAQSVAIYLPINGEADPRGLLTLSTKQSKQFYLPDVSEYVFFFCCVFSFSSSFCTLYSILLLQTGYPHYYRSTGYSIKCYAIKRISQRIRLEL